MAGNQTPESKSSPLRTIWCDRSFRLRVVLLTSYVVPLRSETSADTKKCDTHVYTLFFQPLIRQKQLRNWRKNTYAKRPQKLANTMMAKRPQTPSVPYPFVTTFQTSLKSRLSFLFSKVKTAEFLKKHPIVLHYSTENCKIVGSKPSCVLIVINPTYLEQKTIKWLNVFTMYKTWLPASSGFFRPGRRRSYVTKYRSNVT